MKNTLERIINNYIKEEGHDNFMLFEDDLNELMKRAYNQALEDVKKEAKVNPEGYSVNKESIDKLKIK